MHVVLPKRSSGEWRLRQNDSLNERTPGTLDPGRGTQEWRPQHNYSLIERRPGYTQRHRQLVMLKGVYILLLLPDGALKSGGLSRTTL